MTDAASIRKTEALDKQTMQEKVGKQSKPVGDADEGIGSIAADKKQKGMQNEIDQNGDGKISDKQYAAFLKRREDEYLSELRQSLQDMLKSFDKNADGQLEDVEIEHLLEVTRKLRPKTDFKPIFAEFDNNGDGALDLDELQYFLQNTPWNLLEEIPSSEVVKDWE